MRCLPLLLLLVLAGCPGGKPATGSAQNKLASSAPKLKVTLLRTDLGLADGELVRDADAALVKLDQQGDIEYTPVGDLPAAMENEGGSGDIGLPDAELPPGGKAVGIMSAKEAEQLANQLADSDVLVCSGPITANIAFKQITAGGLKVPLVIVLDIEPWGVIAKPPTGTTVHQINYEIKEAAYLLGVAAGVSSRSQAFAMFTNTQDSLADTLYKAFTNGVHNRMAGGNVYRASVTPDDNYVVPPADFSRAFQSIMGVPNRKIDHFVVFCGRATPSIMYGLSSKPTDGFMLGGYGDFTQVRPARVVGCIVKHPGVGLLKLFKHTPTLDVLEPRLGNLKLTLQNGGVDITDFSAYANYNQDADDIADAVKEVRSEIAGGEIDVLQE